MHPAYTRFCWIHVLNPLDCLGRVNMPVSCHSQSNSQLDNVWDYANFLEPVRARLNIYVWEMFVLPRLLQITMDQITPPLWSLKERTDSLQKDGHRLCFSISCIASSGTFVSSGCLWGRAQSWHTDNTRQPRGDCATAMPTVSANWSFSLPGSCHTADTYDLHSLVPHRQARGQHCQG